MSSQEQETFDIKTLLATFKAVEELIRESDFIKTTNAFMEVSREWCQSEEGKKFFSEVNTVSKTFVEKATEFKKLQDQSFRKIK